MKTEKEQAKEDGERDGKKLAAKLRASLRTAVADYMYSEGCDYCRDSDAHDKHKVILGKMLNVPKYSDGSGYDFSKYRTS